MAMTNDNAAHVGGCFTNNNNNENKENIIEVEQETLVIPRNTIPTPVAPPEPLSVNSTPQVISKPPPCRIDETPQNPKRLLYSYTPTSTSTNNHPNDPILGRGFQISSNGSSSIIRNKQNNNPNIVSSSSSSSSSSSLAHKHTQHSWITPRKMKSSIQSPPERNLTTSSRVNTIVSQLQELNLLSSVNHTNSFRSMFQMMQRSIASCTTYSNRDQQSHALNGILTILESSMEELQNVTQECQYWKQKAQPTKNNKNNNNHHHHTSSSSMSTVVSCSSNRDEINHKENNNTSSASDHQSISSSATKSQTFQQIQEENVKLKTVLEDLGFSYLISSSKDEPSVRSTNNHNKDEDTATQYSALGLDLQNQISNLQNENVSLRQSLQELSNARFQLEMQYNKALLSSSSSPSTKDTARSALERKRVQELLKQEQQLHAALAKKDMECVHAQETIHRLQMQIEMLQSNQNNQDSVIHQWRVELDSARRNSQSISVENARLQSEVNTLRQKLTQEMQRADQSQHDANAAQIGRNELATNYRAVADERVRLEQQLQTTSTQKDDLTQQFSALQLEQSRSQNQIQVLGNDMQQRVAQIYELERELEQTRRQSDALCAQLQATERKVLESTQDLESSRQSSKLMGQQTLELQRLLAKTQHDANAFREMALELEKDRDRWKHSFHDEKNRGLEELLSSARANEAAASEQVKKLARQNAYLVTELNKANARQQISDSRS